MKSPLGAAGFLILVASTMQAAAGDARPGNARAEIARQGQTELAAGPRKAATSQNRQGQGDPEKVIDRITREENTHVGPSGATEPSTGGAEPVENWFGCPPDDGKEVAPAEKNRETCADKKGIVTD